MVDLVKIRKKAKEKATAAVSAVADAVADMAADREPQAPTPASLAPEVEPKAQRTAATAPATPPKRKPKSEEPAPKPAAVRAAADAEPSTDNVQPTTGNRQPTTDNREGRNAQLTSKLERFLQTAGERRVERAQETQAAAGEQLELLTFSIAGELYAVSIDNVVEIVTPRAVTRIPNSDPLVVGILSLRGMIVTLIDARRRLGHPDAAEATPDSRVIVVQLEHETLGFSVDKVLRVVKTGASAIEPHPVVHASEQDDSVRGVFRYADALTILLDLDKLLNTRAAASA